MDTKDRPRLSARTGLAALALVLVIGAIWAATALAAGGSSPAAGSTSVGSASGGSPSSLGLVATTPQQPAAPSGDDCPGHGGSGSGSGGGSSTTDGSSSATSNF
jgi:hypothetical protein